MRLANMSSEERQALVETNAAARRERVDNLSSEERQALREITEFANRRCDINRRVSTWSTERAALASLRRRVSSTSRTWLTRRQQRKPNRRRQRRTGAAAGGLGGNSGSQKPVPLQTRAPRGGRSPESLDGVSGARWV